MIIHQFTANNIRTTFADFTANQWHHVTMVREIVKGNETHSPMRRHNSIDECIIQYAALTRIQNGELEIRLPADHHTFLFRVDIRRGDIGITCLTPTLLADYYKIEWSELVGMREGFNKCILWYNEYRRNGGKNGFEGVD